MSDRISLRELRERWMLDNPNAGIVPVSQSELLALVDAVEAAARAVVLEHDPARTRAQNLVISDRARSLREALARFKDDGETT